MASTLDIRNFTRTRLPVVPFSKIAAGILPGWDISLVFAGSTRAQSLNIQLRNKDYVPNVLSYISGTKSGEIIICPAIARVEAPRYGMPYRIFIAYLFIHGLLHLNGLPHGTTMERREEAALGHYLRFYSHGKKTHSNRH